MKSSVGPECEATFHTLRTLLTTAPVLAQPDIEKPFDVFCDALGIGLGVCAHARRKSYCLRFSIVEKA